jgi:hypothetical protein
MDIQEEFNTEAEALFQAYIADLGPNKMKHRPAL